MKVRTKKLAVLHQLSQEADTISLEMLLQKLGPDYAERSVRRWLAELVKEGLVEKIGKKRGTHYKVLQREERDVGHTGSCFGSRSEKYSNR